MDSDVHSNHRTQTDPLGIREWCEGNGKRKGEKGRGGRRGEEEKEGCWRCREKEIKNQA